MTTPARKPESGPSGANVIFHFDVDANAQFTYKPKHDWQYFNDDILRFETSSGPFTIELIRTGPSTSDAPLTNPFGKPLKSNEDATGPWYVETDVNDGLTEDNRKLMFQSHVGPGSSGFLAKYNYRVEIKRAADGAVLTDDHHNGTYIC